MTWQLLAIMYVHMQLAQSLYLQSMDDFRTGASGTLNGWHRGSVSDLPNSLSAAARFEFITSLIDS